MKPIILYPKKKLRIRTSRQGWRHVADRRIYFRSDWEYRFARYLESLKKINAIKEWEHEPQTFWFEEIKRGTRSYLPDFKIFRSDGSHYWAEVKGYFDAKSKTKLRRFKKYYPNEQLVVIDEEWFRQNKAHIPKEDLQPQRMEKNETSL